MATVLEFLLANAEQVGGMTVLIAWHASTYLRLIKIRRERNEYVEQMLADREEASESARREAEILREVIDRHTAASNRRHSPPTPERVE